MHMINGNSASFNGGGISCRPSSHAGEPTLINCIFYGNSATNGGGVSTGGCDATFVNCMFSGNSAIDKGGGVAFAGDDWRDGFAKALDESVFGPMDSIRVTSTPEGRMRV